MVVCILAEVLREDALASLDRPVNFISYKLVGALRQSVLLPLDVLETPIPPGSDDLCKSGCLQDNLVVGESGCHGSVVGMLLILVETQPMESNYCQERCVFILQDSEGLTKVGPDAGSGTSHISAIQGSPSLRF